MNTQLQEAILSRDLALVRHVLEIDPLSVHHKNEVGFSALMICCTTEQPDMVALLLDAGANVHNKGTETGFYALHCLFAHPAINEAATIKILEMLLKHGAEINVRSLNSLTPLMLASWFGNEPAVRFLIERGADATVKDNSGKSAKDMALAKGHRTIVGFLDGLKAAK